jgi:D-glycero-alpha-D-manno-heptose 1-phosphate guanylyltransferase
VIPAIVLVGGLGTRLAGISGGLPKAMMPVAGRPFLEFVLDALAAAGCTRIVLAVSYRREAIIAHFGDSYRGVALEYSIEEVPMGTGGAIRDALPLTRDDATLVLNGDTLFRVDIGELAARHVRSLADITVALRQVADTARYGAVELDGQGCIRAFHEKGRSGAGLANGGVYVVSSKAVRQYVAPSGPSSFERDVLPRGVGELRIMGVPSDGYFIDIGVPDDLIRARSELGGG